MRSLTQRLMPLIIVTSLLTSCAMGNSDPSCVCPPLVAYSRDFQQTLAKEVAAMNEKDAVVSVLQDYAVVRRQLAACQ